MVHRASWHVRSPPHGWREGGRPARRVRPCVSRTRPPGRAAGPPRHRSRSSRCAAPPHSNVPAFLPCVAERAPHPKRDTATKYPTALCDQDHGGDNGRRRQRWRWWRRRRGGRRGGSGEATRSGAARRGRAQHEEVGRSTTRSGAARRGGRRATRIEVRDRRPRGPGVEGRVLATWRVRRRRGGLGGGDEGGEEGDAGKART